MKILVAAALLLLVGCDQIPRYKCIDDVLYRRFGADGPWQGVDGAPSHKGFTPTPCKASETEVK
jgi:hypothetical protein